jgi:hypothetical protein
VYCDIYLRNGTIYIPTMGKMDKGFYRAVEPVAVVPISHTDALRQALEAAITRGNPPVPVLKRSEWPPPILLKYAGVKSWSVFERGMQLWDLNKKDGIYQIASNTKQPNGMWKDDPAQTITFPSQASADNVIDHMIAILQDATRGTSG